MPNHHELLCGIVFSNGVKCHGAFDIDMYTYFLKYMCSMGS